MRLFPFVLLAITLMGCTRSVEPTTTIHLSDLKGQWVVVNYWAQWCKPCIEEIPELNALHQTYDQVTVVGVNYDGATGAALAEQVEAFGVEFSSLSYDPAPDLGTYRPVVLPTTLIVSPSGELAQTLVGPQTLASLAKATGQSVTTP